MCGGKGLTVSHVESHIEVRVRHLVNLHSEYTLSIIIQNILS